MHHRLLDGVAGDVGDRQQRRPHLLVAAAQQREPAFGTGEARLDGLVPVASTLRYLDLIPGSTHEIIYGTGHTNLVSKPEDFAAILARFAARVRPSVTAPCT